MDLVLIGVGLVIGFIGTIIGAGGGFLVVPLLVFQTDFSPQVIAGTSLTVTLFTAFSGVVAYYKQGKIDYLVAKTFILALIPATFLGVSINQKINIAQFTLLLGFMLIIFSVLIHKKVYIRIPHFIPRPLHYDRCLVDSCGVEYKYHVSLRRGFGISFIAGIIAPMVGIGGGVLKVPGMIMFMNIPARIAAPTSQFITLAGAILGVVLFGLKGQISLVYAIPLSLGVLIGAQVGAKYSQDHGTMVRIIISLALSAAGLLLIAKQLL